MLENVKVLELGSLVRTDGVNTSAEEAQDQELAVASLIRRLPNLIHIHFQTAGPGPTPLARIIALTTRAVLYSPLDYPPLQGLTGLILDVHNFDAAMLLLSLVAPSLRRLCISSTEESFIYGTKTLLDSRTIEFPSLGELLLGESNGADCSQLCVTLAKRWRLPVLHKVSLQSDPAPEIPPGNLGQWRANLEDGLPFSVVSYPGLEDVQRDFANIAAANITELAFAFQHWPAMDIIDFKATLDAVPEGRSQWVKVVVIFEGSGIRQPQGERDRCLIELVNRRRLPSLEKVVWLSPYGDPEEEHLDDEASWSGSVPASTCLLCKERIDRPLVPHLLILGYSSSGAIAYRRKASCSSSTKPVSLLPRPSSSRKPLTPR